MMMRRTSAPSVSPSFIPSSRSAPRWLCLRAPTPASGREVEGMNSEKLLRILVHILEIIAILAEP
jgi:hypothetical protein